MDEIILKVRQLFQEIVPSFGVTHAKVYASLMHGEAKTAKQLSDETGISHNKVYSILKDLARERIVLCINTNPANYHVKNPVKAFEQLVNKKIALLEKRPEEFNKIISGEIATASEKEYLIRFTEKQTRLFDNKNKAIVSEPVEAKQIIKQLNSYIEMLEPKKEYNFAVYR